MLWVVVDYSLLVLRLNRQRTVDPMGKNRIVLITAAKKGVNSFPSCDVVCIMSFMTGP